MSKVTAETMPCMDVWGGNRSTWSSFSLPGLDLWVYSQPLHGSDQGGDVYYLSSCASGRITRMFIGDVSGHGSEASPLAQTLRRIMRRYVNFIDQSRVVASVNREFENAASVGRFATALVSTYFAPTQSLGICSAGHPAPLIFRAGKSTWERLEAPEMDGQEVHNVPLGILDSERFLSSQVRLQPGDLYLGFTDALPEARDEHDRLLGQDGLLTLIRSIDTNIPETFVSTLLQRLRDMNPRNLTEDDTTLLLARANRRRVTLKNNLLAPIRWLSNLIRRDQPGLLPN